MKDLEIILENKPGTLASLGEILGRNGISLEGGGVFYNGAYALAHFLIEDAEKARGVLEQSGIKVCKINEVVVQKLKQEVPGQLGAFCRRLADEGVNILAQYSDHSNQLVLVVDHYEKARQISSDWMKDW